MPRGVPNKKVEGKQEVKQEPVGFYKGYLIRWLREEPDHPDYYLVAEYDKLNAKKEVK